jgi:hypothetical protein
VNAVLAASAGIVVLAACAYPSAPSTVVSAGQMSTPASTPTATGGALSPSPVATESNPPGDIPDNQVFVPYASSTGFTVRVPEGWARSAVADGVSYSDKLNSVTITVTSASAAPTPASARAVDVPTLARSLPKFSLRSVTTVNRPAGPAVLITFQRDSPTDPVTGKVVRDAVERYLFWHGGHVVALTLSGPVGADNVDPWKTVTTSLRWTA